MATGASSGIGRAAAIALGQAGWKLTLSGRRQAELEETARLANAPDSLLVAGDLAVPENVRQLFKRSQDKYGQSQPALSFIVRQEDIPFGFFDLTHPCRLFRSIGHALQCTVLTILAATQRPISSYWSSRANLPLGASAVGINVRTPESTLLQSASKISHSSSGRL
jgi:NAD(P)-dependent dehydrogenase (short-subunit alcohol dehydrogenase family)